MDVMEFFELDLKTVVNRENSIGSVKNFSIPMVNTVRRIPSRYFSESQRCQLRINREEKYL